MNIDIVFDNGETKSFRQIGSTRQRNKLRLPEPHGDEHHGDTRLVRQADD